MTQVQSVDPQHPSSVVIGHAADLLRASKLVVYPTETFYGLAADPRSPAAVERIFASKGRPDRMALPLIAGSRAAVQLDRKSTRLNSSHGYISYAVFCLKKKTKRTQIPA